jgi:hypothetical protein
MAGSMALVLLPKAAMPAGRPKTPTPTMALTKLLYIITTFERRLECVVAEEMR